MQLRRRRLYQGCKIWKAEAIGYIVNNTFNISDSWYLKGGNCVNNSHTAHTHTVRINIQSSGMWVYAQEQKCWHLTIFQSISDKFDGHFP